MYLLPQPQKIEIKSGFLQKNSFCIKNACRDPRIEKALRKLPNSPSGTVLEICHRQGTTEGYTLDISEHKITITGESAAGAFYAVQTLRQLLDNGNIPCLIITDAPGFAYRGFYHDVTRGKIPNMETLKALIDQMAYFKMNSLQLYVEHTFPFKEFGDYIEKNGYLTPEEIRELDDYCYENFIEFIPSIATFGHLYELLQQENSLELAMHGLVLGAAKSWNAETDRDDNFTDSINYLVYKNDQAVHYLTILDHLHSKLNWNKLAYCYSNCIYEKKFTVPYPALDDIQQTFDLCSDILAKLQEQTWTRDDYRQEILIAAEGLMVMAQLYAKFAGYEVKQYTDVELWLKKFRTKWLEKNKESELFRIEEMFTVLDRACIQ